METQTLEFLAFFLSYLLVGSGFLWALVVEPMLRVRGDAQAFRKGFNTVAVLSDSEKK